MTATSDNATIDLPIACSLTPDELAERRLSNGDLFAAASAVKELEDGHAFKFPNGNDTIARLMEFIQAERACCLFFRFTLSFEPNQGPLWLNVQGPAGTKELTAGMVSRMPATTAP
jgi:hypothetical protein